MDELLLPYLVLPSLPWLTDASLQSPVHFRQLAIQLFDPSDQVENDRGPGKVDAQVSPQPLHATKLDHRASRHHWFLRSAVERFNQPLLDQSRDERTSCADGFGHDIEGQRFIKLKITCPHDYSLSFSFNPVHLLATFERPHIGVQPPT